MGPVVRATYRTLAALILTFATGAAALAQEPSPAAAAKDFSELYRNLASIETRLEGSPGEKEAISHITTYLSTNEISYKVSDLGHVRGAHSYSSSIEIYLPGSSEDELLIVSPLNSRESSDIPGSGSINIALALELARRFSLEDTRLSLRVLIAGAEYGDGESYPIGSQAFLSSKRPEASTAVLYLDYDLPPEITVVRAGDRGYVAPYWLLQRCITALDANQLSFRIRGNENQFYRLGVAANPAPLGVYLDSGYPAVSFHRGGGGLAQDDVSGFVSSFAAFTRELLEYPENPQKWDRHYLFFKFGRFSLIIGERSYLIVLLSIAGLLILYPIFLSKRLKSYVASLISNFWALPMLLVLVYLLLLVGTLLVEGLCLLKGYPDYWMKRPAEFFILKLITAIFLFSLLSRYLKRIPFPRRGRFYSAAALLILISDVILLAVVDISLAYYVLWACVWAFLFSLTSSRVLKAFCLLISPAWLIKAAYDMLTIPSLEIAEQMILTRASGNLLVAFILFPFLLMLIRLDFMFRHPKKKTKRLLLPVIFTVLGLGCGGLITFLIITEPFSANDPQPVLVTETQHLAKSLSYIELTSPASLGSLRVKTPVNTISVSTNSRSYVIETPLEPELLQIESSVSRFLGRATYTLSIASEGLPASVRLSLLSESRITVYDSNFPFSFESPNAVNIHIGRYPPNPLTVEFTVPESLAGAAEVRVEYLEPPVLYNITDSHIDVEQRLQVIARTPFGTENRR